MLLSLDCVAGRVYLVLMVLLLFGCILPVTLAQEADDMALFVIPPSEPFTISDAVAVNYLEVYHYATYAERSADPLLYDPALEFVAEDDSGIVLLKIPLADTVYPLFYSDVENVSRVKVVKGSAVLWEQSFTFCDSDGICEPCLEEGCGVSENSLSCSDCSSGSADDYCDGLLDGVCDPDCSAERDADCMIVCSDMNGVICVGNDMCVGGGSTETADALVCCVGGRCMDPGEYVAVQVALQNQPSLFSTEDGVQASEIIEYGIAEYCIDRLKGTFCGFDEYCDGALKEYYPGTFCCMGACVQYSQEEFGNLPENIAVVDDDMVPLTEEEVAQLYGPIIEEVAENVSEELPASEYPAEVFGDFEEDEFPHESLSGEADDEPVFSKEGIEEIRRNIEEASGGIGLVQVTFICLGVLFVIFLLLALFKRIASGKMGAEERSSAQQPAGPDLQSGIDSLLRKGYDYKQIQQILLKRGFDAQLVASEIRRNYNRRVPGGSVRR